MPLFILFFLLAGLVGHLLKDENQKTKDRLKKSDNKRKEKEASEKPTLKKNLGRNKTVYKNILSKFKNHDDNRYSGEFTYEEWLKEYKRLKKRLDTIRREYYVYFDRNESELNKHFEDFPSSKPLLSSLTRGIFWDL